MRAQLSIACLLVACLGSGDDTFEQGDGHNLIEHPQEGMSTQGTNLLGELIDIGGADPVYHTSATTHATSADGRPIEVVFAGGASLAFGKHVGADPFFEGVTLEVQGGGELQIVTVDGGSDVTRYKLQSRATPNDPFKDPCAGHFAIPLAGRWTRTGVHEADPAHISFACELAVAYKCTLWGYTAGDDPQSLRWRMHQACTRMARADYCSNGHSHTRDGTLITIYDRIGIGAAVPQKFRGLDHWPPGQNETTFEAAWNDGEEPASCLSRVRWQSLPLGGICGANTTLKDPRESTDVKFCDDDEIAANGRPLLFNESQWSDLELYVWQQGDDLVSTVRGYYDITGRAPDRAPFPLDGTYTFVRRDAMLLRAFTTQSDPSKFDLVQVFRKGNDHVVARPGDLPADYVLVRDFEGYVARTPLLMKYKPFDLYRDTVTGDVVTTTVDPGGNYNKVSTIGYLPPPETAD